MGTLLWTAALSTLALGGSPPDFEVRTAGGELSVGAIVNLTAENITIATPEGPVVRPTARVTSILRADRKQLPATHASSPSNASPVLIELVDGSQIATTGYLVASGRVQIPGAGFQEAQVPVRDVVSVRLQRATAAMSAEWNRILDVHAGSDLLVVREGDTLDYHQGVLRDVSETTIRFELDGDTLPVKRSKAYGLVYRKKARQSVGQPVCRITESGGSTWAARSLASDGQKLTWSTPLDLKLSRPLSRVMQIDFSEGKVVYLSDLEPESSVWIPYFSSGDDLAALGQLFAPRSNRSLGPGPLQLEGRSYAKGLALHSRTDLVYRLPDRFGRFQATVGIDDSVRPRGHVRLVIRGDETVLFEATIAGTDRPRPIDLDLRDVRRLGILVDFGDDLDLADHLDLCEARLIK